MSRREAFGLNELPTEAEDITHSEILYESTFTLASRPPPLFSRVISSVAGVFTSFSRATSSLFASSQPLYKSEIFHLGAKFRLPPGLTNLGNTCYMSALLQVGSESDGLSACAHVEASRSFSSSRCATSTRSRPSDSLPNNEWPTT